MKKRITSFFMVICFLFTMLPTVASAADGNGISASKTQVAKGDTFTVTLEIPAISDPLATIEFNISFDKETFEVTEYTKPAFAESCNTTSEANAAGMLTCTNVNGEGENSLTTLQDGGVMTATFRVKDTASSGSYAFEVTKYATKWYDEDAFSFVDKAPAGAVKSVTITVGSSGEGNQGGGETPSIPTNVTYTADLDTTSSAVKVGDEVTVNILVGGTTKEFASSELNLTYTGLTYVSNKSTVNGADVTAANGAIKIIDHGNTTTWEEGGNATAYSLVFTVDSITGASGTASVTLSNAALSTEGNASGSNLTAATVTVATKEFTVTPADLTVSLPAGLTGEGTATDNKYSVVYNAPFEFEATNKNYTYTLSVKDADGNGVDYYEASDGKWKINNVTSNVTVEITEREAKTYTITFNPTHIQNQASSTVPFVYGTEGGFSFTLKNNVSAGLSAGTTYAVDSIKYTGTDTNVEHTAPGTDVTSDRTYTIATEAITGNITITTSATPVEPNQFTVTLPTSTYPELTADKPVVEVNGSVVLTLDPVAGYKYTVTYKIGDGEATPIRWTETEDTTDGDKLTYTISDITANVTVSVTERVIDTSKFTVTVKNEYVAMDGESVHLVRVSGELDDDYVLTYDGGNMYWSTGYVAGGEYVYLVITDADATLSVADATAQLNIAKGAPVAEITYTGDVNMTNKIDANDAQLVWNMYKANVYSEFADKDTNSAGATMEKYLRADMNCDGKIYTEDAAAIVTLVKNRTN